LSASAPAPASPRRAVFPSFRSPAAAAEEAARDSAVHERARAAAVATAARETRAAVLAEWTPRLAAATEALAGAAARLTEHRAALAAEVDRRLPEVVLLLARKVIHRELSLHEECATLVARAVVERIAGTAGSVAVRMAPRLADALEAWRHAAGADAPALAGIRVERDASLADGDWVLETRDGFVDGRLEIQLDEAWRTIAESPA
jgi:flagellar biosynthesis/type III secretory pathway protein FliH